MESGICAKVKRALEHLYRALKSLTGLVIILILYNIIGAIIMIKLEGPYELERIRGTGTGHDSAIVLSNTSSFYQPGSGVIVQNETNQKEEHAPSIENEERVWDFWKAMFYCGTIYTTIGYGNIIPATDGGKVFTIFYAAFGIPLAMKVLAVIGKKLSIVLKFVYLHVKRCCGCKKKSKRYSLKDKKRDDIVSVELQKNDIIKIERENEAEKIEQEMEDNIPIAVPVVILIIYIFLGGIMYTLWEDWGYLDAFYFVFISVSTIGFGDITPAHTKYFMVTSVYVFVGLALVSMCINVIIDFYIMSVKLAVHQMDAVKTKVSHVCGCSGRRLSI